MSYKTVYLAIPLSPLELVFPVHANNKMKNLKDMIVAERIDKPLR